MKRAWIVGGVVAAAAGSLAAAPARNEARSGAGDVKRGGYLVRAMGCGDCHTPTRFDPKLGAPVPDSSRMLSGHPEGAPEPGGTLGQGDSGLIGPTFTSFKVPFGVVYASNLTPDPETGLGSWTQAQFIQAMRTGKHMGSGRAILPPMPWMNVGTLSDVDLAAMFAYLRSLPPIKNAVPAAKVEQAAIDHMGQVNEQLLAKARSEKR